MPQAHVLWSTPRSQGQALSARRLQPQHHQADEDCARQPAAGEAPHKHQPQGPQLDERPGQDSIMQRVQLSSQQAQGRIHHCTGEPRAVPAPGGHPAQQRHQPGDAGGGAPPQRGLPHQLRNVQAPLITWRSRLGSRNSRNRGVHDCLMAAPAGKCKSVGLQVLRGCAGLGGCGAAHHAVSGMEWTLSHACCAAWYRWRGCATASCQYHTCHVLRACSIQAKGGC